jgi:hypothetical protein
MATQDYDTTVIAANVRPVALVNAAASIFRAAAGVTNVGQTVKATPGKVFGFTVSNPGAAAAYFNLYNTTSITIGTTVPVLQILVPIGGTVAVSQATLGLNFATAIAVAATDTSTILSAVAPASPQIVNVYYI